MPSPPLSRLSSLTQLCTHPTNPHIGLHHEFRKQKKAEAKLRGERYVQPKDPYRTYGTVKSKLVLSEKVTEPVAIQHASSHDDFDAITPAWYVLVILDPITILYGSRD